MGGKSDTPASPDYVGAAQATAQGNLDATRAATAANRVNQVTPYGNITYTQDKGTFNQTGYDKALSDYNMRLSMGLGNPGTAPDAAAYYPNADGGWTASTTLSPAQQSILDKTTTLNSGLLSTANSGLDYANKVLSKPGVDTSTLPQVGINPGQSYQDAMMYRLAPQITRENQASDAQLANQGVTQGSEAYNNAKTMLNQQHNDLLNNATTTGFNTGLAANQNAFQQQSYNQMQPINVINALRTGTQVTNPTFSGVAQQQTTSGADLLGAAQGTYNAGLNATNASNAQASQTNTAAAGIASAALIAL